MSPYTIVVVTALTGLFVVISLLPLLPGQSDMDSPHNKRRVKTKASH
jgi:hypothetical protein